MAEKTVIEHQIATVAEDGTTRARKPVRRTIKSIREARERQRTLKREEETKEALYREKEEEVIKVLNTMHFFRSLHIFELRYAMHLTNYEVDESLDKKELVKLLMEETKDPQTRTHCEGRIQELSLRIGRLYEAIQQAQKKADESRVELHSYHSDDDEDKEEEEEDDDEFINRAFKPSTSLRDMFDWLVKEAKPVPPSEANGDCEVIQMLHWMASKDREMHKDDPTYDSFHQHDFDIRFEYALDSLTQVAIESLLGVHVKKDRNRNLAAIMRVIDESNVSKSTDSAVYLQLVRLAPREHVSFH
jgi:hypothetical protein